MRTNIRIDSFDDASLVFAVHSHSQRQAPNILEMGSLVATWPISTAATVCRTHWWQLW